MKRLRVILLFLLLGAIVNVAVAWGIALTGMTYDVAVLEDENEGVYYSAEGEWSIHRYEGFGTHIYKSSHDKINIDDEFVLKLREIHSDKPIKKVKPNWGAMDAVTNFYQALSASGLLEHSLVYENRVFEARGWPMLSLWCQRVLYVFDGTTFKEFETRGFIAIPILPDDYWGSRGLPLYPIWPGFVVNLLFYAAFLWLLFTFQRSMRRVIRCKRGLCVKCAYDLRGVKHEACPECGHAC